MKMTCDRVRALLEEHGLEGLQTDDAARAHAADCDECFALLEALGEVDRVLAALPILDAPDALVEQVLASPKPELVEAPPSRVRRISGWMMGGGAIAAALLVGLFSSTMLMTGSRDAPQGAVVVTSKPEPATIDLEEEPKLDPGEHKVALSREGYFAYSQSNAPKEMNGELAGDAIVTMDGNRGPVAGAPPVQFGAFADGDRNQHELRLEGDLKAAEAQEKQRVEPVEPLKNEVGLRQLQPADAAKDVTKSGKIDLPESGRFDHGLMQRFADQRDQIEGLAFQAADGYWQNTYTPGDPTYRMLASRLSEIGIEDQSQPYAQPFDAPKNAALAVTVASDRAAVEGPTRMLVQVGLKGAPQYGRRRPTMNLALVVDAAGPLEVETAKAIRAAVMSFAQSKQAGDQMSLFIAGRPGTKDVEPKRFEYGSVAVAMQEALADRPVEGEAVALADALRRAFELVAGADDETAPLGASAVVLLSARPLGMEVERISDMGHQAAVAGIVLSAIGVGRNVVPAELQRIALAGQGNRWLLSGAEGAETVVDYELSSVSRVVARAARLRIRLAPGVKLVNVLGSRRLDTVEAERVRDAEKSIDLRLARHLGIDADRGEDEDGIQLVIPSYYANDEHPILLDVVVPGPGPVADVQVRYKDLVYLKNGVARARLTLQRGRTERGPLQMAVLKNLVARQLSDSLAEASQKLAYNDVAGAEAALSAGAALVAEVSPMFVQDHELARDAAMIQQYRDAIGAGDPRLIESIRFASKAKILPAPPSSDR